MVRINEIYKKILKTKPSGFWPGFSVGLFYFGYIFFWFWSVRSLVSFEIENKIFAFLIILLPYIITVAGMALFWGVFSYSLFNFFKKTGQVFLPFFWAGTFVLVEYLRIWFFGILWAGPGALLGSHWTLGTPAYLLANLDFVRQPAAYWGIYGIDFLIVFFGTALFLLAKLRGKDSKKILVFEILSTIAILFFANFFLTLNKLESENNKLVVSVIQTKNPIKTFYEPEELLAGFSEKNKLLKEAASKSNVIIFPENADFSKTLSGFLDIDSVPKYFAGLSQKNILIIDSNKIPEREGLKSKTILIDSKEGAVGFYDKKLLTPGGESLPYIAKIPLLISERLTKNYFVSSRPTFIKGEESNVQNHQSNKVKILVCSDIVSPALARKDSNFDFMTNLNNLAVFDGDSFIEKQLLSMAKFRAAENGKYLIISSNFGRSYVINPLGKVINSTESTGYQILTSDIVPNQTRTWYNKLGDIPILILSFIVVLLGLKTTRSRDF